MTCRKVVDFPTAQPPQPPRPRGYRRKIPRHQLPSRPTLTILRGPVMTPAIFSGATCFR